MKKSQFQKEKATPRPDNIIQNKKKIKNAFLSPLAGTVWQLQGLLTLTNLYCLYSKQ